MYVKLRAALLVIVNPGNKPGVHQQVKVQTVINLYNGILFSSIKEWTLDIHNSMHESQNNHADGKKPDKKGYILYDSMYIYL